jgi:beta-ureidopropionase / N-carbamoyl-L-amino-acid hydrolase
MVNRASVAAGSGTQGAAAGAFGKRILDLVDKLARFSERTDALTCTYFSPAHRATAAQLRDWMRAAGLSTDIDAVGNVVGHLAGRSPAAKTLIVGSHYDTVDNAGRFDGRLGILTALVVVEHLQHIGRRLPFHLDVMAFSEEEGGRFSAPYLGSSAIAGRFDESFLERRDANGVSLAAILQNEGVDLSAIRALARRPQTLCGYLEVHIEQGPVLLQRDLPVGVVTSIAGTARFAVTIEGVTGHAGTVPMPMRRDAAAAAAEVVLAVERRCSASANLVGTVGRLVVPHGLINVIPGRCELSLDIRSSDDAVSDSAITDVLAAIEAIAKRRQVNAVVNEVSRHHAVPCTPRLQSALAGAVSRTGVEPIYLPSGAGHDAEMFAGITDVGMLFVRCGNGGISHNPRETVTPEDADVAARVLLDTILNLS